MNCLQHIGRTESAHREAFGVDPHPHRVIALAEDGHIADARNALNLFLQVQHRVVAEGEAGRSGYRR